MKPHKIPTQSDNGQKNDNKSCLHELNELKFCKVSRNSFSNRCCKFQLSILKSKKKFVPKKYIIQALVSIQGVPTDGALLSKLSEKVLNLSTYIFFYSHSPTAFSNSQSRIPSFQLSQFMNYVLFMLLSSLVIKFVKKPSTNKQECGFYAACQPCPTKTVLDDVVSFSKLCI